jgi:hypothetical protein
MNKKLVLGLALMVVLFGSAFAFAGTRADCGFCLPHISMPCWGSCASDQQARDRDRPDATCQGAEYFGPRAPDVPATGL